MRYPVMAQCLRLVRTISPDAVRQIVDIGAQTRTRPLMEVFPDRHHHLFEPTSVYHSQLEQNYREKGIGYTLHKLALGDADGTVYLHSVSADGSGKVTHAQIRAERDEAMRFLVRIEPIPVRRLDGVFAEAPLPDLSYLVKLDVDGVEEKIIAGGETVLRGASFVVIETSMGRQDFCSRASLLEKLGFRIFDLCDNAYYYGQLALVDLVMINNRLRQAELKYRPWQYSEGKLHRAKWQHGFRVFEDEPVDDPFA